MADLLSPEAEMPAPDATPEEGPLSLRLTITLPLQAGAVNSLRLALDPTDAAGPVCLSAEPGPHDAAGEAAERWAARKRAAVAAVLGIGGFALSGGEAEAAGNGNGNGKQQGAVARPDTVTVARSNAITVELRANDTNANINALWITHINGVRISAGQTVSLPTGQTVRLNANGTVTITADRDLETVRFTYRVAAGNGNGVGSTTTVTVNQVPCFTAGTRILTPSGERKVEDLRPGDLVFTLDRGAQPLRWAGRRTVAAIGDFAPIAIRAGTFGPHGALRLSPQHRLLLRDPRAELMFGEPEVLVAAKDLVNGSSVTRREGGEVTYLHLLFDRHEILLAEGLASESYLPGGQMQASFGAEELDEVTRLFPEFRPATGSGYGHAARRMLKRHEVEVLRARPLAA